MVGTGSRRARHPMLRLSASAIAAFTVGLLWSIAGHAALTEAAQANAEGLGPVRVGMTIAQAEKAVGSSITYDQTAGTVADCRVAWPSAGPKEVRFIIAHGVIVRIDIEDYDITTDKGAHIGDAEARIKALYNGNVVVQPHPYIPGGHDLIVTSADDNSAILFETDGEVVLDYRVGDRKALSWEAGCA